MTDKCDSCYFQEVCPRIFMEKHKDDCEKYKEDQRLGSGRDWT